MHTINLEYTDVFDGNKIKKLIFSQHLINKDFNKKSLFALLVDGCSMQPVINPNYSHLVYKKDEIYLVAKVLLTFTNL